MSLRIFDLFVLFVLCGWMPGFARAAEPLELRWVYLQQNLQVTENLPKIEAILRRAAKSGYNGVVLADYKLNVLDRVPDHYFKNAAKFRDLCRELKLEIIPAVASFGYSSGILAHDPNLAEGLPARDVPFVVKGGKVVLDVDDKNLIPGDFETTTKPDKFSGWGYQDEPGQGTFADSTIKEGQKLLVSYYHAVTIYDNQVPCSLTEPKVFEIVENQIRRVEKLFEPQRYFLSHDEIRVANWSEPERASGKTAGQQLADNVRRCAEIIRRINPQAKLCIWSDMFDPHHNAVKDFYLVNGDLTGSWEGLPKDTLIINWNSGKPAPSLKHFANLGHPQLLAGYYDAPPENIRTWLDTANAFPKSLRGAMYTTWQNNFTDLEKFAAAAWRNEMSSVDITTTSRS